jgi:dTDP-4-amino-4,6-dideoxygalactose transaminase
VDWGGRPVDCSVIRANVVGHIPIIQDAAHSFGAYIGDSPASGYGGDFIAWSFQAIKHLTTGDGGALKAQWCEGDIFRRARRLRWFGIDRETNAQYRFLQDIPEAGYKFHMNDVSATIGLANLPRAITAVALHQHNAAWLHEALSDCKVVKLPPPSTGSSWWFYSIRTPKPFDFFEFAEKRGVGAGPVHGRCDHYTGFDRGHHPLPGADSYFAEHAAIPCGWWMTDGDLARVAETVSEWDKTLQRILPK